MKFSELYVVMWKEWRQLGKKTMLGVCQHNIDSNTVVKTGENFHELSA
jgi:hypothetical protein